MIKFLFILGLGMLIGGAWVQYRIAGNIWGRPNLQLAIKEAKQVNTYEISANLEKFSQECYQKIETVHTFPVITVEPYNIVRLRCFQFLSVEKDRAVWKELEMNPTFGLPLTDTRCKE